MASIFNPGAFGWLEQKKEGLSAILQSSKASLEHEPIDYEDNSKPLVAQKWEPPIDVEN